MVYGHEHINNGKRDEIIKKFFQNKYVNKKLIKRGGNSVL